MVMTPVSITQYKATAPITLCHDLDLGSSFHCFPSLVVQCLSLVCDWLCVFGGGDQLCISPGPLYPSS